MRRLPEVDGIPVVAAEPSRGKLSGFAVAALALAACGTVAVLLTPRTRSCHVSDVVAAARTSDPNDPLTLSIKMTRVPSIPIARMSFRASVLSRGWIVAYLRTFPFHQFV